MLRTTELNQNQQQKKIWEIHKCVEIKQQSPEESTGQRKKSQEILKYFEINENKNTIYEVQHKHCLQGNLEL